MAAPIGKQALTALKDGKRGGLLVGRKHSECNDKGECGIKAVVKESGQPIEMQTNEVVITAPAVNDKDTHEFDGKKLTNRQILSKINQQGGGVAFDRGGITTDNMAHGGHIPSFNVGDHVGWDSEAGDVSGTIEAVHTAPFQVNGYTHHASEDEPQYAIKSALTDHVAYHKGSALHKMEDGGLIPFLFEKGGSIPCGCEHSMEQGGEMSGLSDYEKDVLYHLDAGKLRYRVVHDLKHIAGILRDGYGYVTHGKAGKQLHLTKEGIEYVRSMPKRILDIRTFAKGGQIEDEPVTIVSKSDDKTYHISRKVIDEQHQQALDRANTDRKAIEDKIIRLKHVIYHKPTDRAKEELESYEIALEKNTERLERIEGHYRDYVSQWEQAIKSKKAAPGKIYKGVDYQYANPFELNSAIEELLGLKKAEDLTPDEKVFIASYTGNGGLEKYGATGTGLLDEFYTPDEIVKYMWALAYQNGFTTNKTVLEPSCGTGAFIKYAYNQQNVTGYEINPISAKICSILYPKAFIVYNSFEKQFIHNNQSARGNIGHLHKYDLVIGNPPYRNYEGLYAGLGEKRYTKATNFIGYFIFRGLDLLVSGGLLIYIIGSQVRNGGVLFLDQQPNGLNEAVAEKATLVDAYRLPEGLFDRTDVVSEIIVLRKK